MGAIGAHLCSYFMENVAKMGAKCVSSATGRGTCWGVVSGWGLTDSQGTSQPHWGAYLHLTLTFEKREVRLLVPGHPGMARGQSGRDQWTGLPV